MPDSEHGVASSAALAILADSPHTKERGRVRDPFDLVWRFFSSGFDAFVVSCVAMRLAYSILG